MHNDKDIYLTLEQTNQQNNAFLSMEITHIIGLYVCDGIGR